MILLLSALAFAAEPLTHSFDPSERTLDVVSSGGTIALKTGGDRIQVTAVHKAEASMCTLEATTDDGARVEYRQRGNSSIARECIADIVVTVPSGVGVHVKLGKGDLVIDHDGALQAEVGTGKITGALRAAGNLNLGTGNVSMGGLTSPLELKVGSGSAALVYTAAPDGSILITVGQGDVYLDLPDGTPVDARVPPGVTMPHPQKTTAETKLLIGKTTGTIEIE